MPNWRKYRSPNAQRMRSKRARHAAQCRWDEYHARVANDPIRETRTVKIFIQDSHRPRSVIRLQAERSELAWGRFAVWENGQRIGSRRMGRSGLARVLAESLA